MPKIIREYTFEGPEYWLEVVMAKSLPDGEQPFLKPDRRIFVKTIYDDLNRKEDNKK